MANEYSYDRQDANKKKKEEPKSFWDSLGEGLSYAIPVYGHYKLAEKLLGGDKDKNGGYEQSTEDRLETERQNRRKAALSGLQKKGQRWPQKWKAELRRGRTKIKPHRHELF